MSDSEWTWTGSGSWDGTSICIEWFGDDIYCDQCAVLGGGKISDCEKCTGVTCITPECTDNADCKNGVCDVNNTPDYLECQYCEDNNCIPGRKSDKGLGT